MDTFTIQEYIQLVEDDFQASKAVVQESGFWCELLKSHPDLKEAIVMNKFLPEDVLVTFAKDVDDRIRSLVAMKRRLPVAIFELLASDNNEAVRLAIARNPKVPHDILQRMKQDSWEEIRGIITRRLEE
ncbi:MAG: hypothetical protein PHX61_14585 [Alphaproteobacteria bacterium]|nr:hypothetical protein [Alphaproteobacteria bacterium]